jgi:hypothetical protein
MNLQRTSNMQWKTEWKILALVIGAFPACFCLPVGATRVAEMRSGCATGAILRLIPGPRHRRCRNRSHERKQKACRNEH